MHAQVHLVVSANDDSAEIRSFCRFLWGFLVGHFTRFGSTPTNLHTGLGAPRMQHSAQHTRHGVVTPTMPKPARCGAAWPPCCQGGPRPQAANADLQALCRRMHQPAHMVAQPRCNVECAVHCAACGELQAQCNDVSSLTSSANELNIILCMPVQRIYIAQLPKWPFLKAHAWPPKQR